MHEYILWPRRSQRSGGDSAGEKWGKQGPPVSHFNAYKTSSQRMILTINRKTTINRNEPEGSLHSVATKYSPNGIKVEAKIGVCKFDHRRH